MILTVTLIQRHRGVNGVFTAEGAEGAEGERDCLGLKMVERLASSVVGIRVP